MMTHPPVSATSRIVDRIRERYVAREPVRIVAAGTWQRAGAPVTASESLSVSEDRGIVEYVPGDFTLTARGGTTLHEIAEATRPHNQFLTLDPWGGDTGTIGATIATATAGPRAASFGLPRDVVLGMEFVSGHGNVIRAGGRVVKNVAGFDLVRLLTGSWGTLGVITELTLRLRARPEHQESLVLGIDDEPSALAECARRLRALPFTPVAAQLVNLPLARRIGLRTNEANLLLLQIGGNARGVAAQRQALNGIGRASESVSDEVWTALREVDDGAGASWRRSGLPSAFAETWARVQREARALGGLVHGDPWRGVVRAVVPGSAPGDLKRAVAAFDDTAVAELMPADAWPAPKQDATRAARLTREVRGKFDPAGILNPGILGVA